MVREFLAKNKGRRTFLEHEVKGLLGEMGLSVPKGVFVEKGDGRLSFSELAFPLVAKVSSEHISSKSDVRGVRTGINSEEALRRAVDELMSIDQAAGVLVEEMAPPQGVEVIVGGIVDKQFGPVVMFGLGGIFVEIFKDVTFGLAPISEGDAAKLIRQVKGYRLLEAYRGRPPEDTQALIHIIVTVSEIIATNLIEEIDLNPVALYPEGAMILDAKMTALT